MSAPTIQLRRKVVRHGGQPFPIHEVAFVKDSVTVARLVAGDPLLRLLELPFEQAERIRAAATPVLAAQPVQSAAFDALLDYLRERRALA